MKALFKDLYRQYLEKGVSPTDFGQFKEELNHIPDEELWNVMIDMEKDATTEIGMPPMMKKQIRKEMHQIIWRRRWIQITKYAAVIALLVTSSLGVYSLLNTPETQQMITANVKSGSKSEIILPDGTKVQLNGATTITYDVNSSKQRLVQLSGEAFFDVAKKHEQTFLIETEKVQIEVLGTAFNVRSNEEVPFSLSVRRGKVKVSLKQGGYSVFVNAGETVTLQSQQLQLSETSRGDESGVYTKNIRFKDESLEDILRVVNAENSALQIQTGSLDLGKRKLTIEFLDNSPDTVAELICWALNLKYTREGDKLILSER